MGAGSGIQSDGALARDLRHHYLFAALIDAQRERLLASAERRRFAAGEGLFVHGDVATRFFLLRSGCVKLYRLSPEGDEKIMRLIRPSQTFAESILFMDAPRGRRLLDQRQGACGHAGGRCMES